jgi:biopolymer transport protein ExbD
MDATIISAQKLRPTTFSRHLTHRKQKKASRKRLVLASLTLTSMVDMFSLLVIFLLQAFSASPELLVIAKGVTLPHAASAREIKDAPLLTIAADGIHLDQKLVGATEQILKNPEPLMTKLAELRELWQRTHPNEKFKGEINLQASKEVSSVIVSQVMGMLPSQAYGSIQLAVISAGGK